MLDDDDDLTTNTCTNKQTNKQTKKKDWAFVSGCVMVLCSEFLGVLLLLNLVLRLMI